MQTLDMKGQPCPIPVIEAKKALRQLTPGQQLHLLVDNDIACQNLEKMAQGLGHGMQYRQTGPGEYTVTIDVGAAPAAAANEDEKELTIAIGSEQMGRGDDELGAMLMKSYLYALTELDTPPARLLLYNGGVRLACRGAATLQDLTTLQSKGTDITACGACLNFYGLTEELAIGSITNMAAISAAMAQAPRLVNL